MKYTAIALLVITGLLFAQRPVRPAAHGEGKRDIVLATPQAAQDVTIHLSAEAATVLESLRLSTPGAPDAAGKTTPQFATITALLQRIIDARAAQSAGDFPTPSLKAAQDAKDKADRDLAAARGALSGK